MHLVLIETSGNQAYIFATNKLRENVGASELTYRVGTQWTLEAVAKAGGPKLLWQPGSKLREALNDPKQNPPIENSEHSRVEVVVAASGKALLLVRDRETAEAIVSEVTTRALEEAPGLDVRGAVSRDFDWDGCSVAEALKNVHQRFELLRSRLPGPERRFQYLPVAAECVTSGLPAAAYDAKGNPPGPRSAVSLAKQCAAAVGLQRLHGPARDGGTLELPWNTNDLEELGSEWLAVVHADGNGLGQVFLSLDRAVRCDASQTSAWNREYVNIMRSFSTALDACTEAAFRDALAGTHAISTKDHHRRIVPVVPLVVGGDDLTVVCDGKQALRFAQTFLKSCEVHSSRCPEIVDTLQRVGPGSQESRATCVTGCAGIAIVKPHFPFYAAYQLAEQLLASAKKTAKDPKNLRAPWSALDFHILYDASGPDLDRIRRSLLVDGGKTNLTARPFVVTDGAGEPGRRWQDLERWVTAIRENTLPRSMLNNLREGLFQGANTADYRLRLVRHRYQPQGIDALLGDSNEQGSLFYTEEDGRRWTGFLDALEASEFWG